MPVLAPSQPAFLRALGLLPLLALLALLGLASACGGKADDSAGGADGADGDDASSVSYYADVQPMLGQHCVRCHSDGGLGPADFTDPDVVQALAPAMRAAIDEGRMPPAAADPSCQDYVGSEALTMPQAQRDLFGLWVDGGLVMGDPSEAPAVEPVARELKNPDLVLTLRAPYTPAFADSENPGNEYRCFVLDPEEFGGKYITAMAPTIDAETIVHHAVLFTVDRGSLDDRFLGDSGWDCINGRGGDSTDGMLGAWAPGMLPIEFPEGTGMELPADKLLVLQMHYFYNGSDADGVADQSGYAFNFVDSVTKPVIMAPLGSYSFNIPAGDPDYTHSESFENSYVPLNVLGIFPHMHKLGQRFDARIIHADGSETCLVSGDYDFDNQMTYQFREPVQFAMGDEVRFECNWDNSEGDSAVRFGERTDQEMCYFFTLVSP
jgi:mono/diheme cytochrome c family protein